MSGFLTCRLVLLYNIFFLGLSNASLQCCAPVFSGWNSPSPAEQWQNLDLMATISYIPLKWVFYVWSMSVINPTSLKTMVDEFWHSFCHIVVSVMRKLRHKFTQSCVTLFNSHAHTGCFPNDMTFSVIRHKTKRQNERQKCNTIVCMAEYWRSVWYGC